MPPTPDHDLLDRRAHLLAHAGPGDTTELAELTEELGAMLSSADLVVRRLTLDEPEGVIDRLVAAEPVHPFADRADLEDRLDDDRRCFVLEHPSLPGRPLNVVWCALCDDVPGELATILDPSAPTADPATTDTAVFYSIWNVEPGLVGLPGGRTLLLGAIAALRDELPGLSTFVTLSPVPGFRAWLESRGEEAPPRQELVECARYLSALRDDGRPLDAVARFHLGNGARLLALAPDADRSERGMERSFGIMANYRYEPEDRPANRASLRRGDVVVGEQVRELLDAAASPEPQKRRHGPDPAS